MTTEESSTGIQNQPSETIADCSARPVDRDSIARDPHPTRIADGSIERDGVAADRGATRISVCGIGVPAGASTSRASSRHDERNPGFGQLQLGRVDSPHRRAPRLNAGRNPLKRMPRRDLRLPPSIGVPPNAHLPGRAVCQPRRAQSIEPRLVDPLERQGRLKPGLGGSVDLTGGSDGPLPLQPFAVTLETERST
jgi:hypothetical protein